MTDVELLAKRDALLSTIANSVQAMQSGDKSITFQGIAQMEKALGIIDREIAKLTGSSGIRTTLVSFDRG